MLIENLAVPELSEERFGCEMRASGWGPFSLSAVPRATSGRRGAVFADRRL